MKARQGSRVYIHHQLHLSSLSTILGINMRENQHYALLKFIFKKERIKKENRTYFLSFLLVKKFSITECYCLSNHARNTCCFSETLCILSKKKKYGFRLSIYGKIFWTPNISKLFAVELHF